ncbi:MAG: hypothetical protein JZU63_09970 [Rhodoferax sp.]|nr:hypothetical protein [Rhodoferax sp.]
MNIEDQLQRQININTQLRRQLETARRDAVEYCAKYCEDHGFMVMGKDVGKWYAGKLREIVGNARQD